MPDQTERNRARKFAKLARKFAASLKCCEFDAPENDMTVELAVSMSYVIEKNDKLLDLLTRLTRAARLYLYSSNPCNRVPRSVATADRDALRLMIIETETHLRASASPRENNPVNPVNPVPTESAPK